MPERWLRELKRIGELDPRSDLWEQVMRGPRSHNGLSRPSSRASAFLVAMVAVVLLAGGLTLLAHALGAKPPVHPAAATVQKILYRVERTDLEGNDQGYDLDLINADGTGQTRLLNSRAVSGSPAWSPDGTKIAVALDGQIEVMGSDGSQMTSLTDLPGGGASSPTWSPDGKSIAFARVEDEAHAQAYVMNADGSGLAPLAQVDAQSPDVAWSPSGTQVTFTRGGDIYVMSMDGTGLKNLTNDPAALDENPTWSPDGTKIAFDSDRSGNTDIYVMNADGTEVTRLTNGPGPGTDPAWSPDGTKIAFVSGQGLSTDIYVMNSDGTGVTRLTPNSAAYFDPAWQPTPSSGAPAGSALSLLPSYQDPGL